VDRLILCPFRWLPRSSRTLLLERNVFLIKWVILHDHWVVSVFPYLPLPPMKLCFHPGAL
jgi:hypothetical protein